MSQEQPTRSERFDEVLGQVRSSTPLATVELIARQLDRAADARARIEEEGLVVRDVKGSVVPHPGIAIELAATKLATDLLGKERAGKRADPTPA